MHKKYAPQKFRLIHKCNYSVIIQWAKTKIASKRQYIKTQEPIKIPKFERTLILG
jgi:hypothetical protein